MTADGGRAFTAIRGIVYAAAFIALWAWIGVRVRAFDPALPLVLPAWLRPIGLLLACAGALVVAACLGTFVTVGRGTPAPFDPPREFVATGPYRWVRNPMYLGAAAVILGAGLLLSSGALVVLTAGFLLVMHLFVVLHEERALTLRFGDRYIQYRATVRRWLVRRPDRRGTKTKGSR